MSDDDDLQRIIQRAGAYMDVARYTDAVALYESAVSTDPDNAYFMTCLAQALRFAGDSAGCKEYAERAIQTDPEYGWPYRELAQLRLLAGDVAGAYKLANTSVTLAPEDIRALHLLGHCAFALDRNEEVRVIAAAIVDLAPDEMEGHDLSAHVAEDEGDLAAAVRHLQKALEIEPENAVLIENLAKVQRKLKQSDASAAYYLAALSADPHDRDLQVSLRDSIHRFALFGERSRRLRSPAAWLGILSIVYVVAWFWLLQITSDEASASWINRLAFFAGPVLIVLTVLAVRRRFIETQFPQLAFGFRTLRQQARREYLLGIPVVIVCLLGICVILYRAGLPFLTVLAPIWIPIAAIWLALLGLILGVLRSMVTDRAIGNRTEIADIAEAVATWNDAFDVSIGLILFVAAAYWYSAPAFLGAVLVIVAIILGSFKRRPLRAAAILLLTGIAITAFANYLPWIIDLRPRLLGFLMTVVALLLLVKAGWLYASRLRQRRRIRKTLNAKRDVG